MMSDDAYRDELGRTPIDLPRAALEFARLIAYPQLDIGGFLGRLEALAATASGSVAAGAPVEEQARALARFLFVQQRYRGNMADYADPRNSFLNEVLDRRLGIPISLSLLYICTARRLDIPACGVSLPGHFVGGVAANDGPLFLDPFHAGMFLAVEDCVALVRQTTGYDGAFDRRWLQPTESRDILLRMLNNLRGIYVQRREWHLATRVVALMRQTREDVPELLRDLALLLYRTGFSVRALHYMEQYFKQDPDSPEAQMLRRSLQHRLDAWLHLN